MIYYLYYNVSMFQTQAKMKTQVVIQINDSCNQLECAFRDSVDELMLKKISTHYSRPGFNVDHGTNMVRGG